MGEFLFLGKEKETEKREKKDDMGLLLRGEKSMPKSILIYSFILRGGC